MIKDPAASGDKTQHHSSSEQGSRPIPKTTVYLHLMASLLNSEYRLYAEHITAQCLCLGLKLSQHSAYLLAPAIPCTVDHNHVSSVTRILLFPVMLRRCLKDRKLVCD